MQSRKNHLYLLLGVTGIILAGCSKSFLDRNPLDAASSDTYWKTSSDAEQALTTCYTYLRDIDNNLFLSCATDDSYTPSNWPIDIPSAGNGSATTTNGAFNHYWSHFYSGIAAANNLLDNIDDITGMDDSTENRYKSEARFIRAYFYQQLIGFFGDVPLVTHVQSQSEFDVARTPKDSVYAFILSELTDLTPHLPLTYSSSDQGRITRGAAIALKARTYLYQSDWTNAAATAKTLIDLNVYSIEQGGFNSLFNGTNKTSGEIILAAQYSNANTTQMSGAGVWMGAPSLGGWADVVPLQKLVEDFECTDGKTTAQSALYDANNPYENRDPRLKLTVVTPGVSVNGVTIDVTQPTSIDRLGQGSVSGYYYKKYVPAVISGVWSADAYNDEVLIRYAEVLLIYAEAKIESGDVDQSVYDAINQVRQRADVQMPAATSTDYASVADLRTLVHRERHVELAEENSLRLFDIRRWKIASSVMSGQALGILNNYDNTRADFGQHVVVETRNWTDKYYLWAIPQADMDVNKQLTQNTGW